MNKNDKKFKATDWQEMLAKDLKNPVFKRYYDEFGKQLEISYNLLLMRKKARMSQAQLAKKLGTTQSNVARMEAGNQNFTLGMLQRIADAFGKDLNVSFG
ncbi:MAG: helix-turn-helix transcriptional regulator [Parcubacteria group bacterium]|nr:helix-turn-helix transcriptional regulator [Parcubacteria group bacterium]